MYHENYIGEIVLDLDISSKELSELDYPLVEANIGNPNFTKPKNCTVEVFPKEGSNIPHFHITSKDKKFLCCIMIYDNRYFEHGPYKDTLNSSNEKILNNWLHEMNQYTGVSNWETIDITWKKYSNTKGDNVMPDYSTIKSYK